jgi:DNA modification methylase
MKPYYEDSKAGITIYHGDCREILPMLPKVDLVLTDPPYGLNRWFQNHKVCKRFGQIIGDDKQFDPRPFLIAKNHIFWGANHFANLLSNETRWLMWLKHGEGLLDKRDHASFELAWTDMGGSCRAFRFIWDGFIKQGKNHGLEHCHPTEKPVELLRWCCSLVDGKSVLDPFMGSGPTLRAAKELGRKAIGIEIEEKYCEIAAKRLSQEVFEFPSPAPVAEQGILLQSK